MSWLLYQLYEKKMRSCEKSISTCGQMLVTFFWNILLILKGVLGMQKSAILASVCLLCVMVGIIWFVIDHERQPFTQDERVKAAVIEDYISQKYGDDFGWNIQNGRKIVAEEKLDLHPEAYEMAKHAGIDLAAYDGEYVTRYVFPTFPICQKDGNEYGVKLIVYEHNGQYIGDYMGSLNTEGGPRKTITKDEWLSEDHCK